jgi:hypothetical protein
MYSIDLSEWMQTNFQFQSFLSHTFAQRMQVSLKLPTLPDIKRFWTVICKYQSCLQEFSKEKLAGLFGSEITQLTLSPEHQLLQHVLPATSCSANFRPSQCTTCKATVSSAKELRGNYTI